MEDVASKVIAAYQAGVNLRQQREQHAQQQEERDLQLKIAKHNVENLKIQDLLAQRRAASEQAKLLQGSPGQVVPDTTPGNVEGGPLGGGGTMVLPHPSIPLQAIPEMGLPAGSVQPQTSQELSTLLQRKAEQDIQNKIAAEGQYASSPEGIFNKFTGDIKTPKTTTPKPLEFKSNSATGGLETITDPNTGSTYGISNIDTAPPGIQALWKGILGQQEQQRKLKEQDQANRDAAQAARQATELNNALTRQDYTTAKKVVTDADNEYQSALDRVSTMDKNAQDALKGNQQAMLSLVANHIGMTLGGQKGARITQAVWNEAIQSAPWLASKEAKFSKDGYLSGVTLTPDQISQMTELAHERAATLLDHKQRVETQYHDALSAGTRPTKSSGGTSKKTVKFSDLPK